MHLKSKYIYIYIKQFYAFKLLITNWNIFYYLKKKLDIF